MSKRAKSGDEDAVAKGGKKHVEKEAERTEKMEKVKGVLDQMATGGNFAKEQSVDWSSGT